jgi:hypothetical protein
MSFSQQYHNAEVLNNSYVPCSEMADYERRQAGPFTQTQESIMLQHMPPQPSQTREESTDILLKHDPNVGYTSLPVTSASQKPHFLIPMMWMYEILSLLLAVLILGAVVTILALFDNRPSPVVGGMTLDTVVAFAATLFRISLMVPVTDCVGQLA